MAIEAVLKDVLNGENGQSSPIGTKARELALGTVLDTLHTTVAALNDGSIPLTAVPLTDNTATAFDIAEGANSYLKFTTTNDKEKVSFGKLFGGVVTGTVAAPINMADAEHTLVLGTAGAAQTKLTGNVVLVDANSSGTENLVLPAAADMTGIPLFIKNVGGEAITLNTNIATLDAGQGCIVVSDGTAWFAFSVGANT